MAETNIRWASHTWNPYSWNCNKVSPGCLNCYAKMRADRYNGKNSNGDKFENPPRWRGANAVKELLKFPSGSIIFVNSHSDTYHERVPSAWIHNIHNAAAYLRPDLTFLLLTKRPERAYAMRDLLAWPRNLWLGTSVENRDYLWRLDFLLEAPAAGHFLSAEPLLGSLAGDPKGTSKRDAVGLAYYLGSELKDSHFLPAHYRKTSMGVQRVQPARYRGKALDWVIVGAESGSDRRPFEKDWAREIRDMCIAAGVSYMYKQGSAYMSEQDRLLDGREWNQSPFWTEESIIESASTPVVQLSLF